MRFRNEYFFLSNFYPKSMTVNGITYKCLEAAFQSFKLEDKEARKRFSSMNGEQAKHAGRHVKLRSNWNEIRLKVMKALLEIKFSDPELMRKLKLIEGEIVEDNTWGDTFWGRCNGVGQNHLGKLLMEIRDKED